MAIIKYPETIQDLAYATSESPLSFFNDKELNSVEMLNFMNGFLQSHSNNQTGIKASYMALNQKAVDRFQVAGAIQDSPLINTGSLSNGSAMVFLSENEAFNNTEEKILKNKLMMIKMGNDRYQFVEGDISLSGAEPMIQNIRLKSGADILSPFADTKRIRNLNGVSYNSIPQMSYGANGVIDAFNENYYGIAGKIIQYEGSSIASEDISKIVTSGRQLVEQGVLKSISDITTVHTASGVSNNTHFENTGNSFFISGSNLIKGLKTADEDQIAELSNYKDGYYKISLTSEGKLSSISKRVENYGKIDFESDGFLKSLIKDQYMADMQILEQAKVIDTDLKNILTGDQIDEYNKIIKNLHNDGYDSSKANDVSDYIYKNIMDSYVQKYSFKDYSDFESQRNLLTDEYFGNVFRTVDRLDLETIKARVEGGQLFNNRIAYIKDKTTSSGQEKIMSSAIFDPLTYMNANGNRKTQASQKMLGMKFTDGTGSNVDIQEIMSKWTNHIDELQSKKIAYKNLTTESVINKVGSKIYGNDLEMPKLYSNTINYLYTDSSLVFNDSTAFSTMAAMENITMLDTEKTIKVDYGSLNRNIFQGFGKDNETLDLMIDKMQNGNFDFTKLNDTDSFESMFLSQLLGTENFEKYRKLKTTDEFKTELERIGSAFGNISSMKTHEDMELYGETVDKVNREVNNLYRKTFMLSNTDAKINILNPNVFDGSQKTDVAGATLGMINDIRFGKNGIEIKVKMGNTQNSGSKIMIDSMKGTAGNHSNVLYMESGGVIHNLDAIFNPKMSSNKRGLSGTFFAESVETMVRNALTADYGNPNMSYEDKLNLFNEVFSSQHLGNNKNANILDLLNINFSLDNDGAINFTDRTIQSILNKSDLNIMDVNNVFEGKILEGYRNNYKQIFGREMVGTQDSEALYATISNLLYDTYDVLLNRMTPESAAKAKIRFENFDIYRSFKDTSGKIKTEKFERGITGYKLSGHLYGMNETKARTDHNALNISRISQLMLRNNGYEEFTELVSNTALEENKEILETFMSMYDYSNSSFGRKNGGKFYKIFDKNSVIDLNNSTFISRFGINDTIDNFFNSPLGKYARGIERDDSNNRIIKNLKGLITGFDEEITNEIKSFFDNSKTINEEISKSSFMSALDYSFESYMENIGFSKSSDEYKNKEAVYNLLKEKISKTDNITYNRFNIGLETVREGKFENIHRNIINEIGATLQENKTSNTFDDIMNKLLMIETESRTKNLNIEEYKNLLNDFAKTNLGIDNLENTHPMDMLEILKKEINIKRISTNDPLDLLQALSTSRLDERGTSFYKFSTTLTNTLNQITGLENDIFEFKDILDFAGMDRDALLSNIGEESSEVLKGIIKNYNVVNDGGMANLLLLRQVGLNKELPFFINSILSDEVGQIIPSRALGGVQSLINNNIKLKNLTNAKNEIEKIGKVVSGTSELASPWTSKAVPARKVNDLFTNITGLVSPNDINAKNIFSILDENIEMVHNIDYKTLYKANKDPFYSAVVSMNNSEINTKFNDFKRSIGKSILGVSNSFGAMLNNTNYSKADLNIVNKFINNQIDSVEELQNVLPFLQKVITNSTGRTNKNTAQATRDIVYKIESFFDEIVESQIIPTISDMQDIYRNYGKSYESLSSPEEKMNFINNAINIIGKNKQNLETTKWIYTLDSKIGVHFGNLGREIIDTKRSIFTGTLDLFNSMGEGVFGKNGIIQSASNLRWFDSARVSPRDASYANSIAINAIKSAFETNDLTLRNKQLRDVNDYLEVLFGKSSTSEIKSKIEEFRKVGNYDVNGIGFIENTLNNFHNVIVGTDEMYKTSGQNQMFKNNYYAYGFLERDPSQFHGSWGETRFVKIDLKRNRFKNNVLFNKLFGDSEQLDQTGNLMFVGKQTAMWSNGDFDGDTFQILINGMKNKQVLNELEAGRGEALDKTIRLHHYLNNAHGENLKDVFSQNDLTKNTHKEIRKLAIELYGLEENATNKEVYDKFKDYYLKAKYYSYNVAKKTADELSKHSNVDMLNKKVNGISLYTLGSMHLKLNEEQAKVVRTKGFSFNDFKEIFNIDELEGSLGVRQIEELRPYYENGEEEKIFEAFRLFAKNDDSLGIAGLWDSAHKIENALAINRTGIMHDSLTSFREFNVMFTNEKYKKVFMDIYGNSVSSHYKNRTEKMENFFDVLSKGPGDNMFGEMLEGASIGGKHGASTNPFAHIRTLQNIEGIMRESTPANSIINLKKSKLFIEELTDDLNLKAPKVTVDNTITEYVTSLFEAVDMKNEQLQNRISSLTTQLAELLGVSSVEDYGNLKFSDIDGLDNHNLIGSLHVFNTAVSKGYVENITGVQDITRGLAHSAKDNTSPIINFKKIKDIFSGIGRKLGFGGVDTATPISHIYETDKNTLIQSELPLGSEEIVATAKTVNAIEPEETSKVAEKVIETISDATTSSTDNEWRVLKEALAEKTAEIERLKNQLKDRASVITENASKVKKTVESSSSPKLGKEISSFTSQHKTGLLIAGSAVILGSFFRIFQSNRPVINLDINEKQYEKSQGSIYRDLNTYTINTNIRSLY